MKRIIKTYETCSDELLGMLAEKYPEGIKPRHLHKLTTLKGELIKVVELATEDTMYLIKFSEQLEEAIDNIDLSVLENDEDDDIGIDDEDIDVNLALEDVEDVEVDEEDIDDDDI